MPKKYYVYILKRPDHSIFYVGKGQGNRVTNHFKDSALNSTNSVKNNIIKKHGKDNILWEIISYHDNEDDAYDVEEYLISCYGVMAEGGILSNVSKGRYDYPDKVAGYIAKGGISLPKKYSEDLIVKAYRYHFTDRLSNKRIHELTGINLSYMSYLWSGAKCKDLYKKYIESGKVVRSDKRKDRYIKYSDEDIMGILKMYYLDNASIEKICNKYDTTLCYIRCLAKGRKRAYVHEDFFNRYPDAKRLPKPKFDVTANKDLVDWLLDCRISLPLLCKLSGVPKTTLYRYYIPEGLSFENVQSPKQFYICNGKYTTKKPCKDHSTLLYDDETIIFTTCPSDSCTLLIIVL